MDGQEAPEPDGSPQATATGNKRKRVRYSTACMPCQRRKTKCDTNAPCEACTLRGSGGQCEYGVIKFKDASTAQVEYADLKTRVLRLEDIVWDLQSRLPGASRDADLPDLPLQTIDEASSVYIRHSEPPSRDERAFENDTEVAALLLEAKAIGREQYGLLGATSSVIHGNAQQKASPSNLSKSLSQVLASPAVHQANLPLYAATCAGTQTSVIMSLDIDTARMAKKRQKVEDLLAILPVQHVCNFLLQEYFADIDWVYKVLHRGLFEREVTQFWANVSDPAFDPALLDPAWLALLFCMLSWSVSFDLIKQHLRSRFGYQAEEAEQIGEEWSTASQSALVLANWTGQPQIRTLQTLCLLMNLQGSASVHPGFGNTAFLVWLPGAIRIAEALNLDRHAQAPIDWLDSDLALPKGPSDLKNELCNRIWTTLWVSDLIFSPSGKQTLTYQARWLEVVPYSGNDEDFSQAAGWKLTQQAPPSSRALSETTFHWVRVELAHFQRAVNEFLGKEKRTYAMVMDLDAVLQRSIAALPTHEPAENAGCKPYHASVATCVLHNRLLRLHRPFLLKGLSDPKYTYSVEQCTKSARSLCEALVAVVQAHRLDAFWYLLGQTLGAIIVIFIEQFYKTWTSQAKLPADMLPSLIHARELFEEGTQSVSATINKVARQGLLVMDSLNRMETDPILQHPQQGTAFGEALSSIFRRTALVLDDRTQPYNTLENQADIPVSASYGDNHDAGVNPAATEAHIPFLLDSDYLLASANEAFANSGFGVDWSQILTDSALFE